MRRSVNGAVVFLACVRFMVCSSAGAASIEENKAEGALPPLGHTVFCREYPYECSNRKPSTLFFLFSEGALYENLETVNRRVNSAILPSADTATLFKRWSVFPDQGNCADFAVSKRYELLRMGWPSSALLLAEVLLRNGQHHLVLIAVLRGKNYVLDNLSPVPLPIRNWNEYSWVRIESDRNSRQWIKAGD